MRLPYGVEIHRIDCPDCGNRGWVLDLGGCVWWREEWRRRLRRWSLCVQHPIRAWQWHKIGRALYCLTARRHRRTTFDLLWGELVPRIYGTVPERMAFWKQQVDHAIQLTAACRAAQEEADRPKRKEDKPHV